MGKCTFGDGECCIKKDNLCCFDCDLLESCKEHKHQICIKYECPHHENYESTKHYPVDDFESWFIDGIDKLKNPNNSFDILNWYRNLYYQNDNNTERGKMSWAINNVFNKLKELGIDLKSLSDQYKK